MTSKREFYFIYDPLQGDKKTLFLIDADMMNYVTGFSS